MLRLVWEATAGCGFWSHACHTLLGTEFFPLEPRLSVHPREARISAPSRLTNLPSRFHESPSSGFPFGIRIENVYEKVHSITGRAWPGLGDAGHP